MKSTITTVAALGLLQIPIADAQSIETVNTPQESSFIQQTIEETSPELEQLEQEIELLEAEITALQEDDVSEVVVEQGSETLDSDITDEVTEAEIVYNENDKKTFIKTDDFNSNAYNFKRTIAQEGDIYIPVIDNAQVFAEFIDSLPAVVNYYTYSAEEDVIAFYNKNYGEPVNKERKQDRLTVTYYLDDIATRVVISQQDNYRQVDILQESALF